MSLQSEAFAVLIEQHGNDNTVARKPFPTGDLVEDIAAVWMENYVDRRVTDEGERSVRTGNLQVYDDPSYLETDQWVINGEVWTQQHLHSRDGGIRTIYLQRDDKVRTTKPGRKLV